MRFTTGSILASPSAGATRNTNLRSSTPSSWKKAATVWASGAALAPLAACTRSSTKPGDCSRSRPVTSPTGSPTSITYSGTPISRTSSTVLRIECVRASQPGGTSFQSFGSGSAIASVTSTSLNAVSFG